MEVYLGVIGRKMPKFDIKHIVRDAVDWIHLSGQRKVAGCCELR